MSAGGVSNRMFSADVSSGADGVVYNAFKSLTTGRNWNRGSLKVVYDDSSSMVALRCVNHSINPFSKTEAYEGYDTKNINDLFKNAIASEIGAIVRHAAAKVAEARGFSEGSSEFEQVKGGVLEKAKELKDEFLGLVKSKIKVTTDFWEEERTTHPLSRKSMESVILEVEALREMTEHPEMLEMWTKGFNASDLTTLHGKSDKSIIKLMNRNIKRATEEDAQPAQEGAKPVKEDAKPVKEDVKPVKEDVKPKSKTKVSSSSTVEMPGANEEELDAARANAQKFAREIFGKFVPLAKDGKNRGAIRKWLDAFNKKLKAETGYSSMLEIKGDVNEGDCYSVRGALWLAWSSCNFVATRKAKVINSETAKAWLAEMNKILTPFGELNNAINSAKEKLKVQKKLTDDGGVSDKLWDLLDGGMSLKKWSSNVAFAMQSHITKYSSNILDKTRLPGNRVQALDAMVGELKEAIEAKKYGATNTALLTRVRDQLMEMRGLVEKIDTAEKDVNAFYQEFMSEYVE